MSSTLRPQDLGDRRFKCPICNAVHRFSSQLVGSNSDDDVREIYGVTAECPICFDVCTTLTALPCGHILCKDDYQRMSGRIMPASVPSAPRTNAQSVLDAKNAILSGILWGLLCCLGFKHPQEAALVFSTFLAGFCICVFYFLERIASRKMRSVIKVTLKLGCIPFIYSICIFTLTDVVVRLKLDILLELRLIWLIRTLSYLTASVGISIWFVLGTSLDTNEFLFMACGVGFCHCFIVNEVRQLSY